MKRQKAKHRQTPRYSRYQGRRNLRETVLLALAAALAAGGALCLTVLPGVRFSGWLGLAMAGVCLLAVVLERWAGASTVGKWCKRIFLVALSAGALLFLTVETLLISKGEQDNSAIPAGAVIVLGAGVNGETPSLVLQSRIDAAADYLARHPDAVAVLSGGQGPGEDITEAEAMRRGLTARGIDGGRLLLEDKSTSTAENFAFSRAILETEGLDTAAVAVVTSDFHCFRAHMIARRAGLSTFDVPAETGWPLLDANYYIREFFALGKTLIFD